MSSQTFGVDISARWFDVAHREEVRRFSNTVTGFRACLDADTQSATSFRPAMCATRTRTSSSPGTPLREPYSWARSAPM